MNPFYLNPPSLPPEEGDQTQDHLLLTPTTPTSSSSCPIYFNSTQNEGNYDEDHHHQHHQKHKFNTRFWTVESGETLTSLPTTDNHCYNSRCIKQSVIGKRDDQYGDPSDNAPVNLASNVRLMRKMANSDRTVANNKLVSDAKAYSRDVRSRSWDHEKSNNSIDSVIRVCADCNTTKTPLWRSGPRGPKSLCNACGIRQRKARRALANGGLVPIEPSMSDNASKEKKSESHCTTQQKKRFKRTKNKLRLEDFTISLSKSLAFHPQDERDAAILLMALSYGLVCS